MVDLPEDYDLLVRAYEKFIGSSKDKSERELRQGVEDYANGSGRKHDDWKLMIDNEKKPKVNKKREDFSDKEIMGE